MACLGGTKGRQAGEVPDGPKTSGGGSAPRLPGGPRSPREPTQTLPAADAAPNSETSVTLVGAITGRQPTGISSDPLPNLQKAGRCLHHRVLQLQHRTETRAQAAHVADSAPSVDTTSGCSRCRPSRDAQGYRACGRTRAPKDQGANLVSCTMRRSLAGCGCQAWFRRRVRRWRVSTPSHAHRSCASTFSPHRSSPMLKSPRAAVSSSHMITRSRMKAAPSRFDDCLPSATRLA
jgi:hypothetical protein